MEQGRSALTVTGPPGVGKTAFLRRLHDGVDGSVWVDLSRAGSEVEARSALLRALELSQEVWADFDEPAPALCEALAARDNPWVMIDAVDEAGAAGARLVRRLHEVWDAAQIICSSRMRLRLSNEQLVQLSPLELPGDDQSAQKVGQTAAGQLFVDRVRGVWPTFEIDEGNADVVASLLRRLDGLPLAIELATARMNLMGVGELARELEESNRILRREGGQGGASKALDQTIALSWQRLEPTARAGLEALAVLRGDISLDAARATVGTGEPLEVLQKLVDASLLVVESSPDGRRFRVLESIRNFVDGRADAEQRGAAKRRIGRHFAQTAARKVEDLQSARADEALSWLSSESMHLEAILQDPEGYGLSANAEVDCLLALNLMRILTGGPMEWSASLDESIERLEERGADPVKIGELRLRSTIWNQAPRQVETLTGIIDGVLETAREYDDESLEFRALMYGARMKLGSASTRWLEGAEKLAETGDWRPVTLARLNVCRGQVESMLGNTEEARRVWQEGRHRCDQVDDEWGRAIHDHLLGILNLGRDLERARTQLLAAEEVYTRLGLGSNRRTALLSLTEGLIRHGLHDEVEPIIDRCEALSRRQGAILAAIETAVLRGEYLIDLGREDECRHALDDAWGRAKSYGSVTLQVQSAIAMASAALIGDDVGEAVEIMGRLRGGIGDQFKDLSPFLMARMRLVEASICAAAGEVDEARSVLDDVGKSQSLREGGVLDVIARCAELHVDFDDGVEVLSELASLQLSDPARRSNWARMAIDTAMARMSPELQEILDEMETVDDDALLVLPNRQWFRTPDGAWHDLSARSIPWRFFAATAERRRAFQNGEVDDDIIADEQLIEEVWPEQKLTVDAASNRVYVTVNSLRKLGLQDRLQRVDDGYRLDFTVEFYGG